jgi:D-threonate/D-erythronate kinase
MSNPHTAIVSDDLTGALDSAVPFARAGWRTIVATGLPALGAALAARCDVVAVSLNSREIDEAKATSRMRQAAVRLQDVPVLFKKIDSRMKGHVRAEALALARTLALRRMIVCPAIPELGRHVVAGLVVGHGITGPVPVQFAPDDAVGVEYPDAQTDADMDRIVAGSDGALLVGARGLASSLARRSGSGPRGTLPRPLTGLPLTMVIGTQDPTTVEQVRRLRESCPEAEWIAAPDGKVGHLTTAGRIAILQAVSGVRGTPGPVVADRLAATLVSALLAGRRTLVLTGGETAAACLNSMGVGTLQLLGEIQPGLPVSVPLDFPDAPHIVTKSGGFGDPDCLAAIVRVSTDQRRAT